MESLDMKYDDKSDWPEDDLTVAEDEDAYGGDAVRQPFNPSDINVTTPPMNLGDLIDMIREGWINFETDYQRGDDLWSPGQQSRLIESVLLGLRLPAFYFEEVSKRRWNIIDGKQRCCAIRNFCVDQTMTLTDLEFLGDEFTETKFRDFDFATRRDIRMLPITVNLLHKGVPNMVKYILFKRLNTGGKDLTPQEIRNAIFSGKAIDSIKRMAESKSFLEATQGKINPKRKKDMDFVSRFATFYLKSWEAYEPNMESSINRAMEYLNLEARDAEITKMEQDFDAAMELAHAVFGNRAFTLDGDNKTRRSFNKAYFEVISSAFARLEPQQRQQLRDNAQLLADNATRVMTENRDYHSAFTSGTSKREAVRRRHSAFTRIINATLANRQLRHEDIIAITSQEL